MANKVQNYLTITCNSNSILQNIKESFGIGMCVYENFFPEKKLRSMYKNGIDVDDIITPKWIEVHEITFSSAFEMHVNCISAWNPINTLVIYLASRMTSATFELEYDGDGAGKLLIKKNEIITDVHFNDRLEYYKKYNPTYYNQLMAND